MASVLITGTSKGIGMETALVLARAGHTVHATMRDPERHPELGHAAAREGVPIQISTMDVDSDASVAATIETVERAKGSIDVLVNNAGIECRGSVEETSLAQFRAVMETNYFGALRCIQAVLPRTRARRQGSIFNITRSQVASRSRPLASTARQSLRWRH
jgi:NAD(P)-dependent dehydrogenase (short-subunit alcohol dehydrogenase family)